MATIHRSPHLWVENKLGRGFCHFVTIMTLGSLSLSGHCLGRLAHCKVGMEVGKRKMDGYHKLRIAGSHRRKTITTDPRASALPASQFGR